MPNLQTTQIEKVIHHATDTASLVNCHVLRCLLASVRSGVVKTLCCADEMNPNHLHLACDADVALPLLRNWFDNPDLDASGTSEDNGWMTFDLDCDFLDTADWLKLGSNVDLIYASYCTALCMGELVVVRGNQLERHFLHHDEPGSDIVDVGKLAFETDTPLREWSDVWRFVDDSRWTTLT